MRRWLRWFAASARRSGTGVICLLLAAGAATATPVEEFPPVTEAEKALVEVPGQPGAPAVVLFRKGAMSLDVSAKKGTVASFEIRTRIKVLTEAGKRYGEIEITHHPLSRLEGLAGRAVLPGGKIEALPASAIFRQAVSTKESVFVTRAVLPAVEVGTIVDYRYTLAVDSFYLIEPWVFQQEIPVLHSEIRYTIPSSVRSHKFLRDPLKVGIREEKVAGARTTEYRAWVDNLPALVEEPLSFARIDLASRLALVPSAFSLFDGAVVVRHDWQQLALAFSSVFAKALRDDSRTKRHARTLVSSLGGPQERARALFRFVRDEVSSKSGFGLFLSDNPDVDDVLRRGSGTPAEKALLLHALLASQEIPSEILFAAGTDAGALYPELPTLLPFERVLVRATIAGETFYLDADDRCLGFGQVRPRFEGAFAFGTSDGKIFLLPTSRAGDNVRKAELDLGLDEAGSLVGKGRLELSGHHAARLCAAWEVASEPDRFWAKWLEESLPAFAVSEVSADKRVDERRLTVRWRLVLREDDALGDEVSVQPSRPFGPFKQVLTIPAGERKTVVVFPFADSEEVDLAMHWPAGWEIDLQPESSQVSSPVGSFTATIEVDPAARTLRYKRRFELLASRLGGSEQYRAAQDLFSKVETHDAQNLVLVRP